MSKIAVVVPAAFVAVCSVGCDKKPEEASSGGAGSNSAKTQDTAKPADKAEDYDKMLDEYCACKDKECVDTYEDKKLTGDVLSKLTPEQMKRMGDCAFKLPK